MKMAWRYRLTTGAFPFNGKMHRRCSLQPPVTGTGCTRLRVYDIAHDRRGSVLPMMAVGMLVLAGLVGGGVDMGRAYMAERRLQAACDAGVLAGRHAVTTNGFDTHAEEQARAFFNANYNATVEDTSTPSFVPVSEDEGNTINGTASAELQTMIMKVFGFTSLDLSVTCSASMGVGNSDIVLVLDNTGSMAWAPDGSSWGVDDDETRLYALQTAMKDFYDTVEASVQGTNARIRYGFVPYSSSVNVGRLINSVNSGYIANSMTVQSRAPMNWTAVVDTWEDNEPTITSTDVTRYETYSNREYDRRRDCEAAMPADDNSWTAYGSISTDVESVTLDPETGQQITAIGNRQEYRKADYECRSSRGDYYINVRYYTRYEINYSYQARDPIPVTGDNQSFSNWVYQPVTYDTSSYKNFNTGYAIVSTSSGRTDQRGYTWDGCIQERQTTAASSFNFVSLASGITPSAALDLDIDAAPTADQATQWKPLWPEVTFRRGSTAPSFSGNSSSSYCPYRSQLLAEMSESDFDDYADSLIAVGSTYHDIGLLWGARLSSPTGIFASNVNAEPSNGGTVSRHMIFMTDGELQPSMNINSAYGIEDVDQRVTGDGDGGKQTPRHRSRYLAICEAIKARGIRLWVIAFGSGVTLSSDLVACSSPNSAFKADDSAELDEHFQEIAKQVGELRVVQ